MKKLFYLTTLLLVMPLISLASNSGNSLGWAWAEKFGWLHFSGESAPISYGFKVSSDQITGYGWSEKTGWISFNCLNNLSCGKLPYGVVSDGVGNLSGYAWSEKGGWINFSSIGSVAYQVAVDSSGNLSGYAWSEKMGWVNMSDVPSGYGVTTGSQAAYCQNCSPCNPPVLYWAMNENSGATVHDESSRGANGRSDGTISGASWMTGTNCVARSCLNFNGSGNMISRAYDTDLNFKTKGFSVGLWFRSGTVSTSEVLASRYDSSGWKLWINSGGNVCFGLDDTSNFGNFAPKDSVCSSNFDYGNSQWHYIMAEKNVTTGMHLYVDGIQQASKINLSSIGSLSGSSPTLYAGVDSDGSSNSFSGRLDEFKIYDYPRSLQQTQSDYNAGKSGVSSPRGIEVALGKFAGSIVKPVGYWKFDEGFGNTAHNSGTAGTLNGTLNSGGSGGNTTETAMWDNGGKFGKAIEFDGTNDYVSIGGTISAVNSVSFWLKPASTTQYIMDLDGGSHYIWVNSGVVTAYGFSSPIIDVDGNQTATLPDTNWHQITVTTATPINASNITFGKQSSHYYTGLLDEIKFYNYVISSDQIKEEVNGGKALELGSLGTNVTTGQPTNAASAEYCVPGDLTSCAGPVGEWKMDEKFSGDSKTLYDTSGQGNNGTTHYGANATGMDCTKPGKFGTGCQFDGADDYVSVANTSQSINTISFWAKPASTTQYMIDLDGGSHYVWVNAGTVTAHGFSTPLIYVDGAQTSTLSNTTWHYIAITTASAFTINNPTIGEANSTYYSGIIDQVRLYSYVRTPAQIAWEYDRGKPVAEWRMNECQGSITHDESGPPAGGGNNGTINIGSGGSQNAVGTCTDNSTQHAWYNGAIGKNSASLNLDGTDDYVGIGTAISNVSSVSLWIKPGNTSQSIVDFDGGTHKIFIASGVVTATGFTSYYVDGTLSGTVSNTNWHQITAITTTAFNTTTGMTIGKISTAYYSGQVDDAKIFNYALTSQQVKTLYNSGAVSF